MSTPTPMPTPEEPRDDLAAELEAIEAYANGTGARPLDVPAGAITTPAGLVVMPNTPTTPADQGEPLPTGRTRAVRRLAGEVAEARYLVALQGDDAPLSVESARVRRRRRAMREAATLHQLGQDSGAVAWQAARWRRVLTVLGVGALLAGLTWSTAGVHATAISSGAASSRGIASVLAWLIEPCISAVVLLCVGARGYLASRGRPLVSTTVSRIEFAALAGTLTLNTWPYLPLVAHRFVAVRLMVHMVGPLVAVGAVLALTVIWAALANLPLDTADEDEGADRSEWTTEADQGGYAPGPVAGSAPVGPVRSVRPIDPQARRTRPATAELERARDIARTAGRPVTAEQLRVALRVGKVRARELRDTVNAELFGGES